MAQSYDIAIIGPGRVGKALGILAARAGLSVAVGARVAARAAEAAQSMPGAVAFDSMSEACRNSHCVLLTVSDDSIAPLCDQLAQDKAFCEGSVVAHCSGALSLDVISEAHELGCHTGSIHPLQTFPSAERAVEVLSLGETYCFCEGDAEALELLLDLAERIGSRAVAIDSAGKAMYHAAAVMVANYQASLVAGAIRLCAGAGIDGDIALSALGPLIKAAGSNIAAMGPIDALTGPISRGDIETVRHHIDAMARNPEYGDVLKLYKSAGLVAVDVAIAKKTISPEAARSLKDLLG